MGEKADSDLKLIILIFYKTHTRTPYQVALKLKKSKFDVPHSNDQAVKQLAVDQSQNSIESKCNCINLKYQGLPDATKSVNSLKLTVCLMLLKI